MQQLPLKKMQYLSDWAKEKKKISHESQYCVKQTEGNIQDLNTHSLPPGQTLIIKTANLFFSTVQIWLLNSHVPRYPLPLISQQFKYLNFKSFKSKSSTVHKIEIQQAKIPETKQPTSLSSLYHHAFISPYNKIFLSWAKQNIN